MGSFTVSKSAAKVAKVAKLSITERIVDLKRHTIGYVINGTNVRRADAIAVARLGWVDGVKVAYQNNSPHLIGQDARLYDLPIRVGF